MTQILAPPSASQQLISLSLSLSRPPAKAHTQLSLDPRELTRPPPPLLRRTREEGKEKARLITCSRNPCLHSCSRCCCLRRDNKPSLASPPSLLQLLLPCCRCCSPATASGDPTLLGCTRDRRFFSNASLDAANCSPAVAQPRGTCLSHHPQPSLHRIPCCCDAII